MPSQALIDQLETRRQTCQQRAETILARAKADGRDTLTPQEDAEVHQHIETLRTLSQRITDETEELRRGQIPAHLAHLGTGRLQGGLGSFALSLGRLTAARQSR